MNFREHKIAFVGDIKEMFLQIKVQESDRCAQRILWRGDNRQSEPDVYEIQVLFFGAKCSPSIAQQVRNRNALDFQNDYDKACKDIITKHYMDDYLGGAPDISTAVKLIKDVTYVHKAGGFDMRNWISNSPEVLKSDNRQHSIETSHRKEFNRRESSRFNLGSQKRHIHIQFKVF